MLTTLNSAFERRTWNSGNDMYRRTADYTERLYFYGAGFWLFSLFSLLLLPLAPTCCLVAFCILFPLRLTFSLLLAIDLFVLLLPFCFFPSALRSVLFCRCVCSFLFSLGSLVSFVSLLSFCLLLPLVCCFFPVVGFVVSALCL